jgi:hypothetical protein
MIQDFYFKRAPQAFAGVELAGAGLVAPALVGVEFTGAAPS